MAAGHLYVSGLVLLGITAAFGCSSQNSSDAHDSGGGGSSAGSSGGSEGGSGPPGCVSGNSCACPLGQGYGVLECRQTDFECICQDCPDLETSEAPTLDACGGEPFGTWRLTEFETGRSDFEVRRGAALLGTCDQMLELRNIPAILIRLEDGGSSSVHAEATQFLQRWSNECVASLDAQMGCGSVEIDDVRSCVLDCDTCSCAGANAERINEDGRWSRTETTISFDLWRDTLAFDYCVADDQMTLVAPGTYFVFERVHTFSRPLACAERTLEQCELGSGCLTGACTGDAGCETRTNERTCLTMQGCSWNTSVCRGTDNGCALGDYGVVPGCDFVDQPLRCVGTSEACDAQTDVTCVDVAGCELSDEGHCSGGSVDCSLLLSCPVPNCQFNAGRCSGATTCTSWGSEAQCNDLNVESGTDTCAWIDYTCVGTPMSCDALTPEQCVSQPGCRVEPIPE